MTQQDSATWLDANTTASEALTIAKTAAAVQRAQGHLITMILTTLAKTAPKEDVDRLIDELERVRDLSGPAGNAAGQVFAAALSTLERFARRD